MFKMALLWIGVVILVVGMLALKWQRANEMPPTWDANFYLNIGSSFIERGEPAVYMWRFDPDVTVTTKTGGGPGYGVLLLTLWLQAFGLDLITGRTLMYLAGAVFLVTLFFLNRIWWRSTQAALAALGFTALSWMFFQTYFVRMDALAMLTYSGLLLLHLWATRQARGWAHALVGVVAILAVEVHIIALFYLAGLALYYALDHLRLLWTASRWWRMTPAVYFAVGAFLPAMLYLVIHVLPDPDAYFIISATCPLCILPGLDREVARYMDYVTALPLESVLVALGLAATVSRWGRAERHFLAITIGGLLAMALLSNTPVVPEYLGHFLPLMALGVGGMFARGFARGSDDVQTKGDTSLTFGKLLAALLVVGMLLVPYARERRRLPPESPPQPNQGVAYINRYVPPDTVIMGRPDLFPSFLEYPNFLSFMDGERYGIALRGEDHRALWDREAPQVFIRTDPRFDNDDLWAYLNAGDFVEVLPDLWIAPDPLEQIIAAAPTPRIELSLARDEIAPGECATVSWDVEDTLWVFWQGGGTIGVHQQEVCPTETTTYTLSYSWADGLHEETVTVAVRED